MRISEDVRRYAAEKGIAEEEALKAGMAEKSKEFSATGGELYTKAWCALTRWAEAIWDKSNQRDQRWAIKMLDNILFFQSTNFR